MESDSSSSSSSSGYTSRSSTPEDIEIDENGFGNEEDPIDMFLEPRDIQQEAQRDPLMPNEPMARLPMEMQGRYQPEIPPNVLAPNRVNLEHQPQARPRERGQRHRQRNNDREQQIPQVQQVQQAACIGVKRLNVGPFDASKMTATDKAYQFKDYVKRVRAALGCYQMSQSQRYVHFVNELGSQMRELIRSQGMEEEHEENQEMEVLANKIIAHFEKYTDPTKCMTEFMNAKMTAAEEGHSELYHDRLMALAVRAGVQNQPILLKDRYLNGKRMKQKTFE